MSRVLTPVVERFRLAMTQVMQVLILPLHHFTM